MLRNLTYTTVSNSESVRASIREYGYLTVTGLSSTRGAAATITVTARGANGLTTDHSFDVTVADGSCVTIEPTSLEVLEGGLPRDYRAIGEPWFYSVQLRRRLEEGQSLTLEATSPDENALLLRSESMDRGEVTARLVFTHENGDRPQTVTVIPVTDADKDDETVTVSHRITGAAAASALLDDVEVSVKEPGVTIDASARGFFSFFENHLREEDSENPGMSLAEALSQRETYTVKLDEQPARNVTVQVSSSDANVVVLRAGGASPSGTVTLTFTPDNWEMPQTVTASLSPSVFRNGINGSPISDNVALPFYEFHISHAIAVNNLDPAYNTLSRQPNDISNQENDEIRVVIYASQNDKTVAEQVGDDVLKDALDNVVDREPDPDQPDPETESEVEEEVSLLDELNNYAEEMEVAREAGKKEAVEFLEEELKSKLLEGSIEIIENPMAKQVLKKVSLGLGVLGFVDNVKTLSENIPAIIKSTKDIMDSRRIIKETEQQTRKLQQQLDQQRGLKEPEQPYFTIQGEQEESRYAPAESQPGILPSQPTSGGGDQSNSGIGELFNELATALYIHQDALQNGTFSWEQAFSGRQFALPLSFAQAAAQDGNTSTAPRFNALFKGNVNFSRFRDSSADFDLDGTTTAYRFGVDVFPNPAVPLVTGLQLAFTRSHADFHNLEIDTEGTFAVKLFSVHPSIAWDATENLTLWASLGYGRGETEITIDDVADSRFSFVEGSSGTDTSDFFSVAAGANIQVWQSDVSALTLKVDGATASFLDTDTQQGRLAAQFSRDFALNTGRLTSSTDLALLLSNSDTSAMELSSSLNWLPDAGRLSGATSARVLLFGEDRSEWGIGGSVLLQPGEQGEGLSLSLKPSFGQSNASTLQLFEGGAFAYDPTVLDLTPQPLSARLQAEVAYGFRRPHALLTPYTQLNMAHRSTTTSAGLRYALDTSLDLDLSASHRSRTSGNNESRVFLQLRSDL